MWGNRFEQVLISANSPTTSKWNGGIRDPAVGGGTVSFPSLRDVTRRWKHTIVVSLSTSPLHNVALVGARSRFTQCKITNLYLFFRRSHVEGGKRCVVETLVQLHTSVISWNRRQSSLARQVYWSRRPHAPPHLSVHLSKQNITPILLFSLSVICVNS